jgi:hypothetical protein
MRREVIVAITHGNRLWSMGVEIFYCGEFDG